MSNKNYHVYSEDQNKLERLASEYKYLGRYVLLEPGMLTVLALPPKKEAKKSAKSRREHRET